MVIYGQRVAYLRQQLKSNKHTIFDIEFLFKTKGIKGTSNNNKQKYINANSELG
jgi:hypothetical protein